MISTRVSFVSVALLGLVVALPVTGRAEDRHEGRDVQEHRQDIRGEREGHVDRRDDDRERRDDARDVDRHERDRRGAGNWRFERDHGWRFEQQPGTWSPYYAWWWVNQQVVMLPVPTATVVRYPNGRYELRGDGASVPYYWVWVPYQLAAAPPPPPIPSGAIPPTTLPAPPPPPPGG